jgi:hypothetical protein
VGGSEKWWEFFLYNFPNMKESNMNNILSLHLTGGPTFSLFSALLVRYLTIDQPFALVCRKNYETFNHLWALFFYSFDLTIKL